MCNTALTSLTKTGSVSDDYSGSAADAGAAHCCRVAQLMLSGQDIASIAILTPYNGQVRELQSMQKALTNIAKSDVSIDISSVDAYQASVARHSWSLSSKA